MYFFFSYMDSVLLFCKKQLLIIIMMTVKCSGKNDKILIWLSFLCFFLGFVFRCVWVVLYIYIYIYIYSNPQADLFRSIRTHQCGYIYIYIYTYIYYNSVGCQEITLWVCVEPRAILYGKCSISRIELWYNTIIINKYILDIYIQFMKFRLRPLGFMCFLQNNNHQAVKKMKWIENRKNPVEKSLRFGRNLYVWL